MSSTLIEGATVRVRTGYIGRPPLGVVVKVYKKAGTFNGTHFGAGDVKVRLNSTGVELVAAPTSVTVI